MLVVCFVLLTAAAAIAQGGTVTVAWDASPESTVVGYFVYVGHDGVEDRFDAGGNLQFSYTGVRIGTGYTFTVVAYTDSGLTSPRSNEVFYLAGPPAPSPAPAPGPYVPPEYLPAGPYGLRISRLAERVRPSGQVVLCAEASVKDCYVSVPLVDGSVAITAVAPFPDGRVALVIDGRRVVLADTDDLALAYEATDVNDAIVAVVPDVRFQSSRLVYLEVRTERPDGTAGARIVRVRELAGVFGEPATLVPDLPQSGDAVAPVASASDGGLLAALDGTVWRFEGDGVPSDIRVTALAESNRVGRITALAVDRSNGDVWTSTAGSAAIRSGYLESFSIQPDQNLLIRTRTRHGVQEVAKVPVPPLAHATVIGADERGGAVLVLQRQDSSFAAVRLVPVE